MYPLNSSAMRQLSMEMVTMEVTKNDFVFEGDYAMRVNDKGTTLAYFTVRFVPLGLEFRDVRLLKGKNGHFVAAPFRSYEKDGETKYADFWRPAYDQANNARDEAGVAFVEAMAEAAVAEYTRRTEGKKSSGSSNSGGAKRTSGRGPARAAAPVASSDDEDGLPF